MLAGNIVSIKGCFPPICMVCFNSYENLIEEGEGRHVSVENEEVEKLSHKGAQTVPLTHTPLLHTACRLY